MRVAILQDQLRSGGTERQALAIAQGLSALGAETHLVVFRQGGALDDETQGKPYQTHFLPQRLLPADWRAPGLRRLLANLQPDAVIAMGRMANCHLGLLCLRRPPNCALVATFRTGRSIPILHRVALRRADAFVANSRHALARLTIEVNLLADHRAHVIYNGCLRDFDTIIPSFHPANSPTPSPVGQAFLPVSSPASPPSLHLVSISMFRPQKQQLRLIRLCSELPPELNWRLTLAGDGPTLAQCQAETRRLNLQQRVSFPGLLKDPRSLYAAADIAVHVSDAESLPNFLVEAQMAGLPVVAYDTDGVSETFDPGESGFLIRHGDEPGFRSAIVALASNPARALRMSDNARARAKSLFSLDAQSQHYFALVNKLSAP